MVVRDYHVADPTIGSMQEWLTIWNSLVAPEQNDLVYFDDITPDTVEYPDRGGMMFGAIKSETAKDVTGKFFRPCWIVNPWGGGFRIFVTGPQDRTRFENAEEQREPFPRGIRVGRIHNSGRSAGGTFEWPEVAVTEAAPTTPNVHGRVWFPDDEGSDPNWGGSRVGWGQRR